MDEHMFDDLWKGLIIIAVVGGVVLLGLGILIGMGLT